MFKTPEKYIIELDGLTYRYDDGRLEQVIDSQEVGGDRWYISDMQMAVARRLVVEGTPKYVDLLVARKMQETGEFDEPVTVIPHWTKRKSKNTTEIFFTAVPTRLFHHYIDQVNGHEDSLLFFPLYAILFGVLKRIGPKEPVAIIFHHNRFADLVIGTRNRVWHANRFVAFDTSAEQIETLWGTIRSDIDTVAFENRFKVSKTYLLDWIDSEPLPEWPEEKAGPLYALENQRVAFNEDVHQISFFNALKNQTGARPISPFKEQACYHARRLAPVLNAIFLGAVLLLIGGYFWCQQATATLQTELQTLEATAAEIELKVPQGVALAELNQSIAFLKDLARYRQAAPFKSIVTDISSGFIGEMVLENLKIDYTDDTIEIELYGQIAAPFAVAYKGYQSFQAALRRQGYTIVEHRFDTAIQRSTFIVRFSKRLG